MSLSEQLEVEAALLKIRDTNFHKCSNKGVFYYQVGQRTGGHICIHIYMCVLPPFVIGKKRGPFPLLINMHTCIHSFTVALY